MTCLPVLSERSDNRFQTEYYPKAGHEVSGFSFAVKPADGDRALRSPCDAARAGEKETAITLLPVGVALRHNRATQSTRAGCRQRKI